MEQSELKNICPNCGAMRNPDGYCAYCGDPRQAADEDRKDKEFLAEINLELENVTPGVGWFILLVWFGLPVLIIALAWGLRGAGLNVLIWLAIFAATIFISTILAAAIKDAYQHRRFSNDHIVLIKKYILTRNITYENLFLKAEDLFPPKSAIVELMKENRSFDRYLS